MFWLRKYIGYFYPVIAIVFRLMVIIALSGYTILSINKFFSFFVNIIISPFFIKVIAVRLLWYIIPLFYSCLREIRFELQSGTNITFYNLMILLLVSGIDIMPIFLM